MKDHNELAKYLNLEIDKIDNAKRRFKIFSWSLLVCMAALGIIVASNKNFGWEYTPLLLGVLTAIVGTLQKAIDPGLTAEKLKYRKRALESIKVEIEYVDYGGKLTAVDAERLIIKAKEEPVEVLELLANNGIQRNVSS